MRESDVGESIHDNTYCIYHLCIIDYSVWLYDDIRCTLCGTQMFYKGKRCLSTFTFGKMKKKTNALM